MKTLFFFIILSFLIKIASAQDQEKDSLLTLLSNTREDTEKVNVLSILSANYSNAFTTNFSNTDSALLLGQQGLKLAQAIGYKRGEINCRLSLAFYEWVSGDYATAIKLGYSGLEYAKAMQDTLLLLSASTVLGRSYRDQGDYKEALNLQRNIKNRF